MKPTRGSDTTQNVAVEVVTFDVAEYLICDVALQRSQSFCSHTIEAPKLMVVEDATRDSRFQDNPLVTAGPGIRFYAGVKLMRGVGALCVIGRTPRRATESELVKLEKLASLVDIQLMAHGTLSALR